MPSLYSGLVFSAVLSDGVQIDGDDPQHIRWILEKSQERASNYNITGVTYRLTQGRDEKRYISD